MICKRCNFDLEPKEFNKNASSKNGFSSYCSKCCRDVQKAFYLKNTQKVKERKEKYRKNPEYAEKAKSWEKNYSNTRKIKGKTFKTKFGGVLRDILRRCLNYKGIKKQNSTFKLLGYDTYKLKQRIECQFKPGMSWENYGTWHIDHKKPISKFDEQTSMNMINMLCNLQPLWKEENLRKSNKFEPVG